MRITSEVSLPAKRFSVNDVSIQKEAVSFTKSVIIFVTSLQFLSMLLLTAQQTGMPFLVRAASKDSSFLPTTSVFMMEILKVVTCVVLIRYRSENNKSCADTIYSNIYLKKTETLKVCVPAFVYALQNNLYYVALANIDATTYSVTYQLRILTTAILAVLLLSKVLSLAQWAALVLSLGGVVLVQLDQSSSSQTAEAGSKWIGLTATVSMCWTSAFAGVYFEKMLKNPNADMWIQNLRLSLMTLLFASATMIFNDGDKIRSGGLLQGWTGLVWAITIINSIGGLAVSLVMKYADNVKKTYCQTIAIGITAVLSILIGERLLTLLLICGVTLVISSVYIYSFYPAEPPSVYQQLPVDQKISHQEREENYV